MGTIGTGQITLYDQNESPVAVLSNDVAAVPSEADGSSPNLAGAVATLSVMLGTTDVTNLYAVSATPSSGITGSFASMTYTVTGMTVDAGYVDFTAVRAGWPTLTKRFSLAKTKSGINAVAMTSETAPAGTYDGQVGYYNGNFYQWSASTSTWVKQDTTPPTPRYCGIYKYPDVPEGIMNKGDTYLRISLTDGQRGVFVYDSGWAKTVEGKYIADALGDIITVTSIFADGMDGRPLPTAWAASTPVSINTIIKVADYEYYKCIISGTTGSSAPSWNQGSDITDNTVHWKYLGDKPYIYGEPFDYGVPEYQAALFRTAYIHSLRGKDVYLEGNINALGGTFRGSLKTPQLETTPAGHGESRSTPSPTWYHDGNVWDAFSGLAEGKYSASGSFNGRTVSNLYRATNTTAALAAEINYYNLMYAGTVSSNGWQEVATYTSVITGYVRVHIALQKQFTIWGGQGYARIQVNGVTVLECGTSSVSEWEYFNSGDFWINPGDRVSLQLSSGGSFETRARYFRVFPTLSTVGIECTDGSIWAAPGGWRNTADSITANGIAFTATRNYWKGSEFVLQFYGLFQFYQWVSVSALASFNGSPNKEVFLEYYALHIKHQNDSVDVVNWDDFYSAGGSVQLVDYAGDVMTHVPLHIVDPTGSSPTPVAGSLILRHQNSGGISSILFPSARDSTDYGYIKFEDSVSTDPSGEKSRLSIGVQNDSSGANEDDIIFLPSGYIGFGGVISPEKPLDSLGQLLISSKDPSDAPFNGSAIQIREVNRIGNTQAGKEYAPRIGFHWSNVCAASILLSYQDEFQFQAMAGGNNYVPCRASAFNVQSTRTSKKNIRNLTTSALNVIQTIKVVSFNFRNEKSKRIGFIAEDAPEIVAGKEHDRMDLANCVGLLLKAVQELSAENDALKKRIARLEARK
jgi:hypothetical protein